MISAPCFAARPNRPLMGRGCPVSIVLSGPVYDQLEAVAACCALAQVQGVSD